MEEADTQREVQQHTHAHAASGHEHTAPEPQLKQGEAEHARTPASKKRKKSVKFAETPPEVHIRPPEEDEEIAAPIAAASAVDEEVDKGLAEKKRKRSGGGVRARLPGEDEEDLDETDFRREDQGAIKDFDPVVAAKRRAAQREEHRRRNAIMDVSITPADVAEAEEEYSDEDLQRERCLSGDIPLEPFNLKQERETGYFDAFGNYIEYQFEDLRDAWLDSLDDNAPSRAPKVSSASLVAEVEQELDKEDLDQYKRRMISMLQPGETPLSALRRLGARPVQQPKQKHQEQETLGHTAARQRQRKQQRQQQQGEQQQQQQQGEQSGAAQSGGGAQTSSSAAEGQLSSRRAEEEAAPGGGVSMSKGRDGSGGAGEGGAGVVGGSGSGNAGAGAAVGESVRSSIGGAGSNASSSGVSGRGGGVARGSGGGAAVGGGVGGSGGAMGGSGGGGSGGTPGPRPRVHRSPTMDPAASAEFDKLCEYADTLLGYGELSVYAKTREQLMREVGSGGGGSAGSRGSSSSSAGTPQQRRQERQQQQQQQQQQQKARVQGQGGGAGGGAEDEGKHGSLLVEALLSGATPASGEGAPPAAAPAPLPGASSHQASEDDRDMFGDSFEVAPDSKAQSTSAQPQPSSAPTTVTSPEAQRRVTAAASGPSAPAPASSGVPPAQGAPLPPDQEELLLQLEGLEQPPAHPPTSQQHQQHQIAGQADSIVGAGPLAQQPPVSAEGACTPQGQVSSGVGAEAGSEQKGSQSQQQQQQQQQQGNWLVEGGFQLDPASGMYYSSHFGLWCNLETKLYMDAATGTWYRINESGGYEAVPEAGQGFGHVHEDGVPV